MCACGNSYFQITSWLGAVYFGRSQLTPKPLDRAAELCDAVPKGACWIKLEQIDEHWMKLVEIG